MEKPKHQKALSFIRRKLFQGLSTFAELESRISSLPTNQERGDAFEAFAEAYIATQSQVQAEETWPFEIIPRPLRKRFGLDTEQDMGVDGIFRTRVGQHNAYQAKFRSGRPSLTWSEISTFMGLTDQVAQRVLFTNCDQLPSTLNGRTGFYCIRGADLDRLELRDFEVIRHWLAGSSVPRVRKAPLPHQTEALDSILPAFGTHERITTVMACGTGKTLLALWIAERMGCRQILVLVPALALLRQTLHEWLKETIWEKVSYLCVCSDPTVERGVDDIIVRQSDLDFPVSTSSEVVKEFLENQFDGVKVVFSTYQSSRVVAEGMNNAHSFDLGVFDEAHKTAGKVGVKFNFALKDENLPIGKRLFMTATPRHYEVRKKDKEGDSKLVYSMDVPQVYGPVVHKLWFAEAARRDIICNLKIVISVVTSEMVDDELLRRGEVIVKGDTVKARQVANQIALQKAVEKYDVKKIFTFHTTVASANAFTGPGSEGISNHLPVFQGYHVSGAMPTVKRERLMAAFRNARKGIMSNARCLTEGVDLPAVDMVAFLSPKRSRVDIVQATGRAMRKEIGKTTGHVLVPLFLEEATGESLHGAIQRTKFDEVWNVLQAMQEQDDILVDVIRQMREERGQTGRYDDTRFGEKVEFLGPELSLDILRESITTKCVESLGALWDERYGELKAFKKRYGHCNVPIRWEETPTLGLWVFTQRRAKKKGELRGERVHKLDLIGFEWSRFPPWSEMFNLLVKYKRNHRHCNVPLNWKEDSRLGHWVNSQRVLKRTGKLQSRRMQLLDVLGFEWDLLNTTAWDDMFRALVEYKKRHGHCNVPYDWSDAPDLASGYPGNATHKQKAH